MQTGMEKDRPTMKELTTPREEAPSAFVLLQQLLMSLLEYWPHTPDESIPSLLLCGPSGVGKSYLVRSLETLIAGKRTPTESAKKDAQRLFLTVRPSIAPALVVRTRDGTTGLRRLLKREIANRICDATRDYARVSGNSALAASNDTSDSPTSVSAVTGHTVLLVLDHMECFIEASEAMESQASASDDPTSQGQPATRHAALFADLYSIFRTSPGLFTQEECRSLKLHRLVAVAIFGSGFDHRVHPFVRNHVFDLVQNLSTPIEVERRRFFRSQLLRHSGITEEDLVSIPQTTSEETLASALAFRTGGMNYTALHMIVAQARRSLVEEHQALCAIAALHHPTTAASCSSPSSSCSPVSASPTAATTASDGAAFRSNSSPRYEGEGLQEVIAALAQRLVRAFSAGDTVAAFDYRSRAGYIDVQSTRWHDIAGMGEIKETLQALVTRPLMYRSTYRRFGVRPSTGILLYGPPGTGKTMLAKAMATELNAAFLYLNLPELVQSAVGESERTLNEFVALARERSPAIMFVDELQAAFGVRYEDHYGSGSGSGHSVHDARLVAHFLSLLDEIHADEGHIVVFVGATNAVEMLDPLLLRPGRIDTHIAVPLPDASARESLACHVVNGEWASWLPTPQPCAASEGPSVESAGLALKRILVREFVRRSAGWSGAELRNAMNVFALKVLQAVDRVDPFFEQKVSASNRFSAFQTALLQTSRKESGTAEVELSELASNALQEAFKR